MQRQISNYMDSVMRRKLRMGHAYFMCDHKTKKEYGIHDSYVLEVTLKGATIPRLELNGALILAQLVPKVVKA